jgi:hypothetical protein
VHALVNHWDRGSGCCHMDVDQIFVKPTMANTRHLSLHVFVGVNRFSLFVLSF